jgi:hypothetical protein
MTDYSRAEQREIWWCSPRGVRACLDMISFDPGYEHLYLAAAAHLGGLWVKQQPETAIKDELKTA